MTDNPLDRTAMQGAMNRLVRDGLVPVFAAVAGLYGLYVLLDVFLPSDGHGGRVAAWSAALGTLLALMAGSIHRFRVDERWAHPLVAVAAGAVLVHLLDDLRVEDPQRVLTDLCLMLVAIGCVVLSWPWLGAILSVSIAAWMTCLLATAEHVPWRAVSFSLPGAVALSCVVHLVRRRTYVRFEQIRQRDAETHSSLREARDAAMNSEAELKRQTHLVTGILASLPVIAFRVDREGIVRQSLGKGLERFGLKENEAVGSNVFADHPSVRRDLERAMAGGTARYAVSGTGPKGPWGLDCFATADPSPDGGAIGFAIDVSDRRLAEESLRESEARLQQVMDHSPAMIFIKDLNGNYLFVNRLVERTFGPGIDHRGKDDFFFHPRETALAVRENDQKVVAGGVPITTEEVVPTDGVPRTYIAVKFPLRNAQNEIYAVCGIATDVTEWKEAETARRRSELRFRRMFESEAIGIIIGTFDGMIVDANDAFLKMMGYTRDDLPFRWDDITPPEYAAQDAAAIEQMRQTGLATPFSKEYICKDGTRVPILLGCGLLDAESREAIGFVLDLTSRRRADEQIQALTDQLEHAGRLGILGEMAVGIAHELNQPLTAIANDANGAIIRLNNGSFSTAELAERLTLIASDAMTASAVIRKVKAFVTRRELVLAPCDVHDLIDDALRLGRIEARRRQVTIVVNRHEELPSILADGLQIARVILNLVLNAVQAASGVSGREPSVIISTKPRGSQHVQISVEDNGPGISDSVRDRIFRQFVTTREDGLGLGLAMSKSIVDGHSGSLTFVSRPGQGTEFQVVLPVKGEVPVWPPSDEAIPAFAASAQV